MACPIGREMVLVDSESGGVHVLNPTAALVWQCLDGESSLEEIVTDLAEGFDAPVEVLRDDVARLIETFNAAGLLDGSEHANREVAPSPAGALRNPVGLPIGHSIRLDTRRTWRTDGEMRQTLLVNWSSSCGFCLGILPELAALQPSLERAGVDVVLIDKGDASVTRAQLAEHGLGADVLQVEETPFQGMGTPVAYLLDGSSAVASDLAYGATDVVKLARSLALGSAGNDDEEPRFLPVMGGVCGPNPARNDSREWQPTGAYQIGSYTVGVRANNPAAEELVAAALARYRLGSAVVAPTNFSVILSEPGPRGRRDLNLLLAGSSVVARSRSPLRVLEVLAGHLSCLIEGPAHLVRIDAVGAVVGGEAVLLPKAVLSSLDRVQGSLRKLALALVDGPYAHVDPDRRELVVPEASIRIDRSALARFQDIAPGASEPLPVQPGRYRLRYWLLGSGESRGHDLSPGGTVARALGQVVTEPGRLADFVDPIAGLIAAVQVQTVASGTPGDLLAGLTAWRGAA